MTARGRFTDEEHARLLALVDDLVVRIDSILGEKNRWTLTVYGDSRLPDEAGQQRMAIHRSHDGYIA